MSMTFAIVLLVPAILALFAAMTIWLIRILNAANERALAAQAQAFEVILVKVSSQIADTVTTTVRTVGRELYGEREPAELPPDPDADKLVQQAWFLDDSISDFTDPGTPNEPDPIRLPGNPARETTASIRPGEMPLPNLAGELYDK